MLYICFLSADVSTHDTHHEKDYGALWIGNGMVLLWRTGQAFSRNPDDSDTAVPIVVHHESCGNFRDFYHGVDCPCIGWNRIHRLSTQTSFIGYTRHTRHTR